MMAFSANRDTYRWLAFLCGVQSQKIEFANSIEEIFHHVDAALMRSHVVRPGNQVVLVCGFALGALYPTNMALLHRIGD